MREWAIWGKRLPDGGNSRCTPGQDMFKERLEGNVNGKQGQDNSFKEFYSDGQEMKGHVWSGRSFVLKMREIAAYMSTDEQTD